MKIEFESGHPARILFKEKHLLTVTENITVETLVAAAKKNTGTRTFAGKGVENNSVMAMTEAHQQGLFSWLIKNKQKELEKIKKNEDPHLITVPVLGCIISKDVARTRGAVVLGLTRKTGTVLMISHFERHIWKGEEGKWGDAVKLANNLLLNV